MKILSVILFFLTSLTACNNGNSDDNGDNNAPPENTPQMPSAIGYSIIKTYPHDTSSYTQGLIWYNNTLYEGTGRYGFSKFAKVDINTGKSLQEQFISKSEFGEGITIFNNKIYQLTWQEHKVHVYDINTFKKVGEFQWNEEGWGLTHDGKQLIVSTGSSNLYFVNPETFQITATVSVEDNYGPVGNLNELEFINGYVYANKYESNYIYKIDPKTGKVEGRLDLKDIYQMSGKSNTAPDPLQDVLNGIAYNAEKNTFYVTGKQWNTLFEIKLIE